MWNDKPTLLPPFDDGSLSRAETEQLEQHFRTLSQNELINAFLLMLREASLWRQRQLVDILAKVMIPGDAWLILLEEQGNRRCRQVAHRCVHQWSNDQVLQALLMGTEAALETQNAYQLSWIMALTSKVAKERPEVSLRPVERLLWQKKKEFESIWRTNRPFSKQVKSVHKELIRLFPSIDLPLTAMAPQRESSLPVPADGVTESRENLPVPVQNQSEGTQPGVWERLLRRFQK